MPTTTDLVTDLPADFAVFGQGVDTTMAGLKGGTTGQILSKTSATDMAFTWIANDQGDITGVTATSPLTGGGTSGAITVGIQDATTSVKGAVQLSDSISTTSSILASTPTATKSAYDLAAAAIPKSTVTTSGDVIYATGSGAVTRLGIGTTGQLLSVSGGVPAWATVSSGGMTSIASGTLSGSAVNISSIAGTYTNLQLEVYNMTSSTSSSVQITINGLSSNYGQSTYFHANGSAGNSGYASSSAWGWSPASTWSATDNSNHLSMTFFNYAATNKAAIAESNVTYLYDGGATRAFFMGVHTNHQINAAITSISINSQFGTFSGGSYVLYGVK